MTSFSYPINLPSTKSPARISWDAMSIVGVSKSPFSASAQTYSHQGQWFEASVELPPMERAAAEEWVAFLLALNGREGTFLLGDPAFSSPRGTWSGGSPKVAGGSQTGNSIILNNLADGLTAKKGDFFQLGTGSTSRLHKVTTDSIVGGSPSDLRLDMWPSIRTSPASGDAVVVLSPKGVFRLKDNRRSWSVGEARIYGMQFACEEAL